ncbi:hypothetical protein L842_3523 [Mycobacterium intracellulare MIN_052511_1280]|nr:hypothetical protein L842_3523 [Mycobacterium intracellulare MIN_052511_1280]
MGYSLHNMSCKNWVRGLRTVKADGRLIDTPPPVRHGYHELALASPQGAARQEI